MKNKTLKDKKKRRLLNELNKIAFQEDRKSTRLNSSHIPYLVCRLLLEKKKSVDI